MEENASRGRTEGGSQTFPYEAKDSFMEHLGLNNLKRHLHIESMIQHWKADVVCLQETKLKCIDISIIRSLWGMFLCGLGVSSL